MAAQLKRQAEFLDKVCEHCSPEGKALIRRIRDKFTNMIQAKMMGKNIKNKQIIDLSSLLNAVEDENHREVSNDDQI